MAQKLWVLIERLLVGEAVVERPDDGGGQAVAWTVH